jgi:peptidoglycan/LPS O-acetylase OafA/YrhL
MTIFDAVTAYVIANVILALLPVVLILFLIIGILLYRFIESTIQKIKNKNNTL